MVGDLSGEVSVHGLRLLRDQTFQHVFKGDSAAPTKIFKNKHLKLKQINKNFWPIIRDLLEWTQCSLLR